MRRPTFVRLAFSFATLTLVVSFAAPTAAAAPGVRYGIAGVVNADGNVMGLMPHPEHAVDALTGSTDGALLLGSLVDATRRVEAAVPAAV